MGKGGAFEKGAKSPGWAAAARGGGGRVWAVRKGRVHRWAAGRPTAGRSSDGFGNEEVEYTHLYMLSN